MFAHGTVSPQLFLVVWIFLRFLGVIYYNRWILNEGHKNYFKDCFLVNSQPTFLFLSVVSLCLKDNMFDKTKNVFNFTSKALPVSPPPPPPPFLLGSTFNPKFLNVGYQNLKSSCHGYLPGGLTIFLVKKRLKNKIWLWGLNSKSSFWPLLTKQPKTEIGVCVIVKHVQQR